MKTIDQSILELFFNAKDASISGEKIAQTLGISRTAVWNHIKRLKELGYTIEARPHRGYFLTATPDRFIPDEIKARLRTRVLGQKIFSFEQTDSTNDLATQLAEQGEPEGTLVLAETQRKGRGRLGRKWISNKQGLWMSLILRPRCHPSKLSGLTLFAALALVRAIQKKTSLAVSIKWPNDLMVEGKKVCGILSEMKMEPEQIRYLICGIGINVNGNRTAWPQELQSIATTLEEASGEAVSRVSLLCEFLEEFETLFSAFPDSIGRVLAAVKPICLNLGKDVHIQTADRKLAGRAVDLDENGALILENNQGKRQKVYSGDLSLCS